MAKIAAVAAAAAAAAVVAFGVSSVKAFMESEAAIAQTNATLKSTKGVAGVTADAIDKLSTSLEKQTRFSDEAIRGAQNMLLTFTRVGKEVFPDATAAILDMATAMGTDLKSTSIQVGKALNDPIQGVTALQRVGVRLTDSQKDLIQSMMNVGDVAGAQKVILKELETQFGGSAKAAGETFAGKLDILKNRLNNVQEGIGEVILRALTPVTEGFLNWFDSIGGVEGALANLKSFFTPFYNTMILIKDGAVGAYNSIRDGLGRLKETLQPGIDWFIMHIWPTLKQIFILLGEQFVRIWGEIKKAFEGAFEDVDVMKVVLGILLLLLVASVVPILNVAGILVVLALAVAQVVSWIAQFNAWLITLSRTQHFVDFVGQTMFRIEMMKQGFMSLIGVIRTVGEAFNNIRNLFSGRAAETFRAWKIPGFAKGVNDFAGGPAVVGENGPELLMLPKHSSIIPNTQMSNFMSGRPSYSGGGGGGNKSFSGGDTNIGQVIINSKDDADYLLARIDRKQELASMGMAA